MEQLREVLKVAYYFFTPIFFFLGLRFRLLHLLHLVAPIGFLAPHFLHTCLFSILLSTILSSAGSVIGTDYPSYLRGYT